MFQHTLAKHGHVVPMPNFAAGRVVPVQATMDIVAHSFINHQKYRKITPLDMLRNDRHNPYLPLGAYVGMCTHVKFHHTLALHGHVVPMPKLQQDMLFLCTPP